MNQSTWTVMGLYTSADSFQWIHIGQITDNRIFKVLTQCARVKKINQTLLKHCIIVVIIN